MTVLYTDGGARGNPGPAAIGGVSKRGDSELFRFARTIGWATNNQAEYQALIEGLRRLRALGVDEVECYLDSQLVVEQLGGRYRVKNAELKPLFSEVQSLASAFSNIKFVHVPRAENSVADGLVNQALDLEAA